MNDTLLEKVMEAKRKIVEGSLTIWNARLETLAKAGDYREVLQAAASAIETGEGNGCPCNGNCPTKPDSQCSCPPPDTGGCGSGCSSIFRRDWLGEEIVASTDPIEKEPGKEAGAQGRRTG